MDGHSLYNINTQGFKYANNRGEYIDTIESQTNIENINLDLKYFKIL